jgi:serine/threonine-protein kinase
MGEVYRARDTKLGRDVAIKVLPEDFSEDPERLARFHREAKLLASLNHPNMWAFGAVLYEMLTGNRAFVGDDISDTLAAVLRDEPAWDALPAETSPTLRNCLRRCLEKDPKQRVRDMGDVGLAMDGAFETSAHRQNEIPGGGAERRSVLPAIAVTAVLSSVLAGIAVWSLKPEAPRPLVRFVANPPSAPPTAMMNRSLAITPDGRRIIYEADRTLVVRDLDQLGATPLSERSPGLLGIFLSPDGRWVGYFQGRALKKISILGGPAETIIHEIPEGGPHGASWGPDDTIVFATTGPGGLWRVSSDGGEPEQLTTPDPIEGDHRWPEVLPGGEAVLFTMDAVSSANVQIAVLFLDSGETKVLMSGGSQPRYAPTGHIVYSVGETLRAVGFDLAALEVTSDPIPVLDDVGTDRSVLSDFAIARNGSFVYNTTTRRDTVAHKLVWVDREGNEEELAAELRNYIYPRISPDGTRVALAIRDQEQDIWVWDLARETLTRLTFDPNLETYPTWTPDGGRIAYSVLCSGTDGVFWKAVDGTGVAELLAEGTSSTALLPQSFSSGMSHQMLNLG